MPVPHDDRSDEPRPPTDPGDAGDSRDGSGKMPPASCRQHDWSDDDRDMARVIDPIEEGCVGPRETARPAGDGVAGAAEGGSRGAGGLTADDRFKTGRLAGLAMGSAIWVLSWP
ncbi:MAG: hypothetical protein AAF235_01875, partial [Planctomycetota bacterium]